MRIAWLFLLLSCACWAQGVQNMEFYWMLGGLSTSSTPVASEIASGVSTVPLTNVIISGSAGFAMQIGWAYQLPKPMAGYLWLEVPMTYGWQSTGTVSGIAPGTATVSGVTVASIDRNTWFLTPGVRLKTPTYGRVSFYGALGGGAASVSRIENTVNNQPDGTILVNSRLVIAPVFDFAGGIDLRLSRRVSLRAEGRDFFSGAHLAGVSGHNHPVGLIGLVFHL